MKLKKLKTFALAALLLIGSLAGTACDWKKAERPLVATGYNVQNSLLAAGQAAQASYDCKVQLGQPADKAKLDAFKSSIKEFSNQTEAWNKKLDEIVELNPQSKVELLAATNVLAGQVGKTLGAVLPGDTKTQEYVLIVQSLISAAQITIAAVDVSKPVAIAKVKTKIDEAANKAIKATSRDNTLTVCLIDKVGVIASAFTANTLAQKGLDVAALRALRIQRFNEVQGL